MGMNVVPNGPWKRVTGALMLLHILVSYTINQQIFTRGLFSVSGHLAGLRTGFRGRAEWFCATTVLACCAFLLAVSVPEFDVLVDFVSAVFIVPLCFLMPIVFFIAHLRNSAESQESGSKLIIVIGSWAVLVSTTCLWIAGTVSTVKSVANSWKGNG